MSGVKTQANMHTAIGVCQADNNARVCNHNDFQQFCGIVPKFNPYDGKAPGWYGDHGVAPNGNWVGTCAPVFVTKLNCNGCNGYRMTSLAPGMVEPVRKSVGCDAARLCRCNEMATCAVSTTTDQLNTPPTRTCGTAAAFDVLLQGHKCFYVLVSEVVSVSTSCTVDIELGLNEQHGTTPASHRWVFYQSHRTVHNPSLREQA
jgi:hypothetical protein